MKLIFAPKEPQFAYVSNRLWLPKAGIRTGPVKKALEFTIMGREGQEKMEMWDESPSHIICPREFLPPSDYLNYRFPFIDLSPQFAKVEFRDKVVPRNEEQSKAWGALATHDNGILNLGCGKGKTKLSLKKIAQMGVPTLVIVPDGGMMEQWKASIRDSLEFDGKLGIVQGQTFDWKDRPIVIALVTTLALRIRDENLPEDFFRYFGLIVYDEVHQLGAPVFSLTATPFYGHRIGLTATVQREDGLDPVFRYHIGEPFYSDLTQDLVPRIYFQQTPTQLDLSDARVNGMVNVSILRTMLGRDLVANTFRYWKIKTALDEGRKILCLSHSKDQLKLFHAMFPESGLIVQETANSNRMSVLRDNQLCFAIARLGSTGVDDDALDTLFWLTPFKSRIALQQSMGRIQRMKAGKKTPVMVVFDDYTMMTIRKLVQKIRGTLREWNFAFENLRPDQTPTTLPEEVRIAYDYAFAELPDRTPDDPEDD